MIEVSPDYPDNILAITASKTITGDDYASTIIPAIENFFNTELFPADIYVISDFPAEMRWPDVTRVIISALLMSFLATIYPAWRASKVQPAEALRYE